MAAAVRSFLSVFTVLCQPCLSQSLALAIAKSLGAEQEVMRSRERERFLQENCEPLETEALETSEIQDLCRRLHTQIDLIDDELYDLQFKVSKGAKEVDDLTQKVQELRGGRSQRPALRRVRMSADALLRALLGNKHKVTLDLRASLKQVKKEEERVRGGGRE
ncbi:UNVERIFIED_CONTAM: hypothetical protein FKN15_063734 [Acipenser sinensis]